MPSNFVLVNILRTVIGIQSVTVVYSQDSSFFKIVKGPSDINETCINHKYSEFPGDVFNQDQRIKGALFIHIFIFIYICGFIVIICHDYFVPSLQVISEKLELSPDVAGATFMAIGTSSVEFFTCLIEVYLGAGDIGTTPIIGSAIFNTFAITSLAGFANWNLNLSIYWFPIVRDTFFYTLATFILFLIAFKGRATIFDASIFISLYTAYIITLYYNSRLMKFVTCFAKSHGIDTTVSLIPEELKHFEDNSLENEREKIRKDIKAMSEKATKLRQERRNIIVEFLRDILIFLLRLPKKILKYAILDCRDLKWREYYMRTFSLSMIWLSSLTYILLWMATIITYTLNIPDFLSSLTIIAIATSLPEVISSIVIVKKGLGNMVICNLIGSNIFNILFCLGVPWLFKTSLHESLIIKTHALIYTVTILLISILFLFATFIATKWKLNKKLGICSFVMYIVFGTLISLFNNNFFGKLNPDYCKQKINF